MPDARPCRHPSATRAIARLRLAAAAAPLLLGGCYTQRHFFHPAAVPQGAGARPVRLFLNRPVSVTITVTDSSRGAALPGADDEPAATRIVGRVRWTSADSIEVEPREVYGARGWRSVTGAPPIRLAWTDLARAEQRQLSPGRTAVAVVVSTLAVAVAFAGMLLAIDPPYSPGG